MNPQAPDRTEVTVLAPAQHRFVTAKGLMTYGKWCRQEVARMRTAGAQAGLYEFTRAGVTQCCVVRSDNPLQLPE